LWFLAPPEGLDDAHLPAAVGAWFSQCERGDLGDWRVILFGGLRAEQGPSLCDIGLSPGTGEQTIVADPVKTSKFYLSTLFGKVVGMTRAETFQVTKLFRMVCTGGRLLRPGAEHGARKSWDWNYWMLCWITRFHIF
jgi:hypothetical protein